MVFKLGLTKPPTHTLRPINPDNACLLRITETSGHENVEHLSGHPSTSAL